MEEIMAEEGDLELKIIQGVFIGPGRNGKSSLMKRLLGEKVQHEDPESKTTVQETSVVQPREETQVQPTGENPGGLNKETLLRGENNGKSTSSPSTDVAANALPVIIKYPFSEAAQITSSEVGVSSWSKVPFDQEVIKLLRVMMAAKLNKPSVSESHQVLTQKQSETSSQIQSNTAVTPPSEVTGTVAPPSEVTGTDEKSTVGKTAAHSPALPTDSTATNVPVTCNKFKTPKELLQHCLHERNWSGAKKYLESSCIMYLTDTGGQIVFQELLPALVSGPSVFFIVFRLDWDLDKLFHIHYTDPEKGDSKPYKSSIILKDALLQTLASIASLDPWVYDGKQMKLVPRNPKIFFVGTHRDLLNDEAKTIEEVNSKLKKAIQETQPYKNKSVQFDCKSGRILFVVNNLANNDSDFETIRESVKNIIDQETFKVRAPPQWLIFGLSLRQEVNEHVISIEQCHNLAKDCGIHDTKEMKQALRFLSTSVGLIRYFQKNNFKDLSKIVIRDPVIIFKKITKLVVHTFTFSCSLEHDDCVEKGLFSESRFDTICKGEGELTGERLLNLLKCLHIIAPVEVDGVKKFFMPSILSHARAADHSDCKVSAPFAPALLVCFHCRYCPKGVFPALIAYLLNNGMKSEHNWESQNKNYKDQFTFSVKGFAYSVTLIVTPDQYIKILCIPNGDTPPDLKICTEIRTSIESGIKQISSDLHYVGEFYFGFECPEPDKSCHGAVRMQLDGNNTVCCHQCKKVFPKSDKYHLWFPESKDISHDASTSSKANSQQEPQRLTQNDLFVVCDAVYDVRQQWKNLGGLLGVDKPSLDAIGKQHHYSLDDCLREVLSHWLKQANPLPTWRVIVDVLRKPMMNQPTLAGTLEAKYCPAPKHIQSLAELHSATETEPMKAKARLSIPRPTVSKPGDAGSTTLSNLKSSGSLSKPQAPLSSRPSRIPIPIQKPASSQSSISSSTEYSSLKLPSTLHQKYTSKTVDKRPSPQPKQLGGTLKPPTSASKKTSSSTFAPRKVQPLTTMRRISSASTIHPKHTTKPADKRPSHQPKQLRGALNPPTSASKTTSSSTFTPKKVQPLTTTCRISPDSTMHPKHTTKPAEKRPSSQGKQLRGALKLPESAFKKTSPSTFTPKKEQPLTAMPCRSPASAHSLPPKSSQKTVSPNPKSRAMDNGT